MKKILCLLLVVVLAFACVSCNKKGDEDDGGKNNDVTLGKTVKTVSGISEIIAASAPTEVITTVNYAAEGEEPLFSSYKTYVDRAAGVEKFEFSVKRYPAVEELWPTDIKQIQGTVWKKADGSVISSEGDAWSAADAVGYLPEKLTIKASYFKSVEFNEESDMTAVIEAKNSAKVFGVEIAALSDITLKMNTNGLYLYEINVSYTAASGAVVTIVTTYDYADVTITDVK